MTDKKRTKTYVGVAVGVEDVNSVHIWDDDGLNLHDPAELLWDYDDADKQRVKVTVTVEEIEEHENRTASKEKIKTTG